MAQSMSVATDLLCNYRFLGHKRPRKRRILTEMGIVAVGDLLIAILVIGEIAQISRLVNA